MVWQPCWMTERFVLSSNMAAMSLSFWISRDWLQTKNFPFQQNKPKFEKRRIIFVIFTTRKIISLEFHTEFRVELENAFVLSCKVISRCSERVDIYKKELTVYHIFVNIYSQQRKMPAFHDASFLGKSETTTDKQKCFQYFLSGNT